MKPRDYQIAAVGSVFTYFREKTGDPIVAMPTGTGKSIVIGSFIQTAIQNYPSTRVLLATHVKELIVQDHDRLLDVWPEAPISVYSAGLKKKNASQPIVIGGIASIARANILDFGHIDLMIVDECHLVSHKEDTMYRFVIAKLREINPAMKVIGFTATDYRLGQGRLTEPGGIFTDVCFNMTTMRAFNWLLDEGYLVPPVPRRTGMELDVSEVPTIGGEYVQRELQATVDRDEVTYAAVHETIIEGHNRHAWLIFSSGVQHAIHVCAAFNAAGIKTTVVHSKMKDDERDGNIAAFKRGDYRAIVNNGILTTGFDHPAIDLIAVLRPTQSPGLWVQMLGRGTRPVFTTTDLDTREKRLAAIAASQKQNCLVLDFAGNTRRLGPINDPVIPRRKGEKGVGGEAPVRLCEACNSYNHASATVCAHCGAEFPRSVKIAPRAGFDDLIATDTPKVSVFQVNDVRYSLHQKQGKPPAMVVTYYCGLRMFREWVCLEHPGFPSKKARDWWRDRTSSSPPATINGGLGALAQAGTLRKPTQIRVWLKPKYDEILSYDFSPTTGAAE